MSVNWTYGRAVTDRQIRVHSAAIDIAADGTVDLRALALKAWLTVAECRRTTDELRDLGLWRWQLRDVAGLDETASPEDVELAELRRRIAAIRDLQRAARGREVTARMDRAFGEGLPRGS